MPISRMAAKIFCLTLALPAAGAVSAQDYPQKPIRIYTSAAGGAVDSISRLIAQGITGPLGQPVVIDNRGGSGVIPGELTSKAPPDGYTLAMQTGTLWLSQLFEEKLPYDTFRDFAPIMLVAHSPSVLVVNASLPVKSVKELIALARARPGDLNYAKISTGAPNHLGAELFNAMARVRIVAISYRGTPMAVADLVSGQVHVMWATIQTSGPHVASGRLRALAVTSAEPSPLLPNLPTVAAAGLPGYVVQANYAFVAPARTPDAIIARLHQETARVLRTPAAKERLAGIGADPVVSTPAELTAIMKSELATMGKIAKETGAVAR
jgi:tripartite-type tricarboxylate transporter receptor subunit TctC